MWAKHGRLALPLAVEDEQPPPGREGALVGEDDVGPEAPGADQGLRAVRERPLRAEAPWISASAQTGSPFDLQEAVAVDLHASSAAAAGATSRWGVAMWPATKTAIGAVPVLGSLKGWTWARTVIRRSPCWTTAAPATVAVNAVATSRARPLPASPPPLAASAIRLAALLAALDPQQRPEVMAPCRSGPSNLTIARCRSSAEVGGVFQQPLLAALHVQDERGDRGVGDGLEGVADLPLADRVDPPDQVEVDPGRYAGRRPGRAAGCRRSAGRRGPAAARRAAASPLSRSRRSTPGGQRGRARELHPGADRADVGLVEERRVGQGDLGAGDVGVAAAFGAQHSPAGRGCRRAWSPPLRLSFSFGLKPSAGAVGRLVAASRR